MEENNEQVVFDGWDQDKLVYFGPLTRTLIFNSDINSVSSAGLISQLLLLNEFDQEATIRLYINTPGGSVRDAFAIYDVMRTIEAPILGIVNGMCYSGGLVILAGASLRAATPNSMLFYHQVIVDDVCFSSVTESNDIAKIYNINQDQVDGVMKTRFGIKKKVWKNVFEGKTSAHLTAEEALEYGLIDSIIEFSTINKTKLLEKAIQNDE